jgi:hypothetical protein
MTGRSSEALALADELVTVARDLNDSDLLVEAYHAKMPGLLRTGDIAAIKDAAQEVLRLYDRERHGDHAYYFGGHDSRVCARGFLAQSLWSLGFPDQAEQTAWRAIEDARALGHTFSIGHGLIMGSLTFFLLNDVRACQAIADELSVLAERSKLPWPLTHVEFMHGWLKAQGGDMDAGLDQMRKGADAPASTAVRTLLLTLVAAQQFRVGQFDAAVATLDRAMNETRVRSYEAEAIRLRGEILLAQSPGNAAAAEAAFRQAMTVATRQSNRAMELRAGTSLAQVLADGGRRDEARNLLAPIYGRFTEGFDKADLVAARTLLAELS